MHTHCNTVSVYLATERIVTLEDGDTIRVMLRNTTNSDDITTSFLQISIAAP